jgi:hypothetical protein
MKPKKNHKFCVACGRPKMLFETEAEAQAFIRFNSGDILKVSRKAPVRSYYCQLCGGYHVTSNPSKDDAMHMDERDKKMVEEIDEIIRAKKRGKPTLTSISEKMEQANILLTKGAFAEVESLLKESRYDLRSVRQRLSRRSNPDMCGVARRESILNLYVQKLEKLKELTAASEEEQETFIKKEGPTKEDKEIATALISINAIAQIDNLQKEIANAFDNQDYTLVKTLGCKCQLLIGSIHGPGRKEITKQLNKDIHKALHKAKVGQKKITKELMMQKELERKSKHLNDNIGDFDSIMDKLLGKPGSPEREAFRREALEYCSQMEENENESLDVTDN